MAALTQLSALLALLATKVEVNPVHYREFSQRLEPVDWESLTRTLKDNPALLGGVDKEQSFRIDPHVSILSYYLGPPAGKIKQGELGILVVRDGELAQIASCSMGDPVTGIDAIAFLDMTGDGLRDVVMIYRYLSQPGPTEFTSLMVFVAQKDGSYSHIAGVAPWARGAKTIAEVKARLKEAKAPKEPMPPPTHSYVMDGFLDSKKLKCTGKAVMEKDRDDPRSPCLVWTLTDVKCKGKGDADWVHAGSKGPDGASGRICHKKGGWEYIDDLPGLGSCDVNEQEEPMPAKVSLSKAKFALGCIWTCRGEGRSSCEGAASYEFVPLRDTPASPTDSSAAYRSR